MKKLICFILLATLALSCAVFAETTQEEQPAEIAVDAFALEAADFLQKTGVLAVADDADFNAEVTRKQAVNALLEMRGLSGNVTTEVRKDFYDVPSSYEDYNNIMAATKLNIAQGYTDNTFKPDDIITVQDFSVMAVSTLGYKMYALVNGGYPSGYILAANEVKLYENVNKTAQTLTYGEMLKMVYNVVKAPLYKQTAFGDDENFEKHRDVTILTEYYDIYKSKGIMKTNLKTSISGSDVVTGKVEIDGRYYIASDEFEDFLGCNIDFWYKAEPGEDIGEILYAKLRNDTKVTVIKAKDIKNYYSYRLNYNNGEKVKTIKLDKAFKIVYNGKAISDYILNYNDSKCIFKQKNGNFEFVDSNGDDYYDLVKINTYTDAVIQQVKLLDETELNVIFENGAKPIILDFADKEINAEAVAADGTYCEKGDITNLTAGTVVSVYADKYETVNGLNVVADDAKYVRIIESDKTVSGTLDGNYSENGINFYIINGEEYPVAVSNYLKKYNLKLGDNGTFLLNIHGEIVDYKENTEESTGFKYGYLINAATTSGIGGKLQIRMLKEDGTVSIYDVVENLNYNGKTEKDYSKVVAGLTASAKLIIADKTDMSQLVKYKLNADEKIFALETIIDNEHHDDRLSLDDKKKTAMVRTKGGVFVSGPWTSLEMDNGEMSGTARGFYFVSKLVFSVPDVMKDEDARYSLMKFTDERSYTAEAWDIGDNLTPAVMVCYTSGNDVLLGARAVVKEVAKVADDDGFAKEVLRVHTGMVDAEYTIEKVDESKESIENYNMLKNLQPGDVVALYGDTNENIVRRAELLFSLSAQPDLSTRTETNKTTSRSQFAELYYVEGKNLVTQRGILEAGKTKREEQFPWNWATDTSLMRGAVLVDVTENPDKPIIRKATLEDLRPAFSFGNEKSSKLFTIEESCTPFYIVIYNGI